MDQPNTSFEPMDIDLSAHSSYGAMDIDVSFNESPNEITEFIRKINDSVKSAPIESQAETTKTPRHGNGIPPHTTNIKKFHINMLKETASTNTTIKVKVVCAGIVLLLSVIAYQLLTIQCGDDINVDKLKKSLSSKLYGQTEAIDGMIKGLSVNESRKILILYGSTGVGKTFAASTLLEHAGHYSNVYHYTMPSFMDTFTTDFMVGLTVCQNSIIIVDDLSPNDWDVKVHIANIITKSEILEKGVTVLLIYNCDTANDFKRKCDESFLTKIMDNLKQIKAYKKIIRFETLTEEHIRKCIETELGHRKITDEELRKILKYFDATVDGCKRVHTKMKLLDIS